MLRSPDLTCMIQQSLRRVKDCVLWKHNLVNLTVDYSQDYILVANNTSDPLLTRYICVIYETRKVYRDNVLLNFAGGGKVGILCSSNAI